MAIKFSQFNERTESTATMSLVGYDGEQNIRILADDLLANPYINGTENTLAMFGTGGTILADSMLSQNVAANLLSVDGGLTATSFSTFQGGLQSDGPAYFYGTTQLGDAAADLIQVSGTLYLDGPVKDVNDTLGDTDQILVSDAGGNVTWTDLTAISTGTAQKTSILVKNIAAGDGGVTLTKGTPVYIYGSVGASERLYVDAADASNAAKMPCVGLLDQDLLPNGEGTATVTGKLKNLITSPIDGATPTENDTLYVKPGGGLTLTKPTGVANLIQNVGQVGRVSTSSDGNIVVSAILRSNDIPNLTQGKIWVGSTGNTIESATVHLDEATNRLGINNVLPSETLDVDGTLRSTSFAYFSTDGPTSFVNIGSTSTTLSQLNLITTSAGSETSIIQGSRVLRLRVDNTDTKSILLNNSGEVSLAAYGGGTITGTAAYNLSVDASGNIIETTAVPGNIVETLTAASGTYISLTDATSATGDVDLGTFDLSAIDGSSDTTTRFLSKDNTWDIPSYTTVTTTDGTYINLTPNSATSGAVTVTADLSAVDGVAAVGERYLTKNNTWAEVATIPGTYTFNVSDGTASTTINSGDTLGILGGTYITTSNTTGNVTINHDATSRTDTTSTSTPGYGGTFTVVDSISTNATGHLEAINVKTVTMPPADDTNTTYDLSGFGTTNGTAGVQLIGSDGSVDQVAVTGAGTTTVVHSGNTLTITSNDQYTGTVTSVSGGTYITDTGTATDPVLNHDATSRTDTTSSDSPGVSGSFTAVDSVTTNATGHVTAINVKTVTLPDDGVDGSGTLNYVAKWTPDGDTLGDSVIYDDGTNVGIGTTSPGQKLDVIVGNNNGIRISSEATSNPWKDIKVLSYVSESQAASFSDGSHIYTTNPSGATIWPFTEYGALVIEGRDNNQGGIALRTGTGTGLATRIAIREGGNVGIGTTDPGAKTHIYGPSHSGAFTTGALMIQQSSDNSRMFIDGNDIDSADGILFLNDYSLNAVRLGGDLQIPNGDIGIGFTTAPTQRLHVAGNVRVTGAYYDSNNSAGTSGQVLSSTGTGTSWVAAGGAYTPSAISTNTNAVNNYLYILTANLTLTLPASPSAGDSIKIANFSGVTTCVIARNGNNIMASATDLTLDNDKANFELVYTDATRGWVIIGATGELN